MAAAGSTVGSAVGMPGARNWGERGSFLVPRKMGLPLGPRSEGLVLRQESISGPAAGSGDGGPVPGTWFPPCPWEGSYCFTVKVARWAGLGLNRVTEVLQDPQPLTLNPVRQACLLEYRGACLFLGPWVGRTWAQTVAKRGWSRSWAASLSTFRTEVSCPLIQGMGRCRSSQVPWCLQMALAGPRTTEAVVKPTRGWGCF